MEQQQVKLSGAIPVCGGGGRLAICAWKEPGGGSNQLTASSRSVLLHLREEVGLPELNPPLLHRHSSTPPPSSGAFTRASSLPLCGSYLTLLVGYCGQRCLEPLEPLEPPASTAALLKATENGGSG